MSFRWMRFSAGTLLLLVALAGSGVGADRTVATSSTPRVVATVPRTGETTVPPALSELRITFSEAMRADASALVAEDGRTFPEVGLGPRLDRDGRTFVVQVFLAPDTEYAIWVNSASDRGFRSLDGRAAAPFLLAFRTGPAAAPAAPGK